MVEVTSPEPFVLNDVELDGTDAQIVVLTGPNTGGKSTYLRQVALIVLMGVWVDSYLARSGSGERS